MSETRASNFLIWIARIWSLAGIAFVFIFLVGEALSDAATKPTTSEWVGLAFWPGGVGLGLLVAWFRERLGGTLALLSLAMFYAWNLFESGRFPSGPYFILVAAPGLLFILWSLLPSPRHQMTSV